MSTLSMQADLGICAIRTPLKTLFYKGIEFHFHIPSEHTFEGVHRDMEMHIVHKLIHGPEEYPHEMAVLGVLFSSELDRESSFIQSLNFETLNPCPKVDLKGLVERTSTKTYHYDGSLTTPPCSEVVHWYFSYSNKN